MWHNPRGDRWPSPKWSCIHAGDAICVMRLVSSSNTLDSIPRKSTSTKTLVWSSVTETVCQSSWWTAGSDFVDVSSQGCCGGSSVLDNDAETMHGQIDDRLRTTCHAIPPNEGITEMNPLHWICRRQPLGRKTWGVQFGDILTSLRCSRRLGVVPLWRVAATLVRESLGSPLGVARTRVGGRSPRGSLTPDGRCLPPVLRTPTIVRG